MLIVSICIVSAYAAYILEYSKKEEFILVSEVSNEMDKAGNVLELLLPHFVISRVKEGVRYISEDQGVVTVLFCNICDFEELVSDLLPHELTEFLDELFGKFDQLCEIVGVAKIETVGKTYMACAGLKDSEAELESSLCKVNHARRIIELGFGMIRIIQKTLVKHTNVHVKIGINSGPVRAGVVGYHKPQFSLVGDTVNIASRMASTLKQHNSIQITQSTHELLSDSFGFTFDPQNCYVKGKGNMDTFIVNIKPPSENNTLDFSPSHDTLNVRFQNLSSPFINSFQSIVSENSPIIERNSRTKSKKQTLMDIEWKESILFQSKASDVIETVKLFDCSVTETRKEKKFRIRSLENGFHIFHKGLSFAIATYGILLIVEIVYLVYNPKNIGSFNL